MTLPVHVTQDMLQENPQADQFSLKMIKKNVNFNEDQQHRQNPPLKVDGHSRCQHQHLKYDIDCFVFHLESFGQNTCTESSRTVSQSVKNKILYSDQISEMKTFHLVRTFLVSQYNVH